MGYGSLNTDVNGFKRLQIVCGLNSSYCGSKRSCTVRVRSLGALQSALDERLVDDYLGGDIRQFASLPSFDLFSHRFEVPPHPIDSN